MLKNIASALLLFVSALFMVGCDSMNSLSKHDIGMGVGAVVGGVVGNHVGSGDGKTIMTVLGAVAGGYFGGKVGEYMDNQDKEHAMNVAQQAIAQPVPVAYEDKWRTQRGTPVATRVTTQAPHYDQGRTCKRFVQETTIRIDGKPETATKEGTACFEATREYPQGTWVIQQ